MSKAIEVAKERIRQIEIELEELDKKWDRLSDQGQPTHNITKDMGDLDEEKERLEKFIENMEGKSEMKARPTMLLIEDNIELRDLLVEFLSDSFEVVVTLDREEIEMAIPTVDVVVCDYHFSKNLTFEEVVEMANEKVPVILNSSDHRVSYKNQVNKLQAHVQIGPLAASLIGGQ